MEIWNWQKLCASGLYPILSFVALTFRSMPIPARIVTDSKIARTIASIDMTVFEQIRGVTMPKRVGVNLFDNPLLWRLASLPIASTLTVAIIKIASSSIRQRLSVKEILLGFFGFDVLFKSSNQMFRKDFL